MIKKCTKLFSSQRKSSEKTTVKPIGRDLSEKAQYITMGGQGKTKESFDYPTQNFNY